MKSAKWENWVNLLLGVWFFATPWMMVSYSPAANWNAWLVGGGIAFAAFGAIRNLRPWEEWVNIILGVWVVLSPWVFRYSKDSSALWTSVVVGLAVAGLATAALQVARKIQVRT